MAAAVDAPRSMTLTQRFALFCLSLVGWRIVGGRPVERKFVLIAAPHTSNWDLALMLLISKVLAVEISWIGKHTLFSPPMGGVLRALGGVSVDRRSRQDLVQQM